MKWFLYNVMNDKFWRQFWKQSNILKLALPTNPFTIIIENPNGVITVLLQLSFGKSFMAKRSFLGQVIQNLWVKVQVVILTEGHDVLIY